MLTRLFHLAITKHANEIDLYSFHNSYFIHLIGDANNFIRYY